MSGHRGAARTGKLKLSAKIRFADTGRVVSTNIMVPVTEGPLMIVERIERKYGKALEVLSVRHRYTKLFVKEAA